MNYLFSCENCDRTENINIPVDKYDQEKTKQKCIICGKPMQRVIEFEGNIGLCSGMYGTGKNGWNK